MNEKKEILVFSTIHRNTERFIPVLEALSKEYKIIIIRSGQISQNTKFESKNALYKNYFNANKNLVFFDAIGISKTRDRDSLKFKRSIEAIVDKINFSNVALAILDDSRCVNHAEYFYKKCNENNVTVFANSHGNDDKIRYNSYFLDGYKKIYDYLFVFGERDKLIFEKISGNKIFIPAGIPSNDSLSKYQHTRKYILFIVNFIDPSHSSSAAKSISKKIIEQLNLSDLQKRLKLPIVFKVKHRINFDVNREIEILKKEIGETLDYKIVTYTDDENKLVMDSACVMSHGSTMCFKTIQAGIPTVIIRNLGVVGNFNNYFATISPGENYFHYITKSNEYEQKRKDFLKNTLSGALNFNSTQIYIDNLKRYMNEKNINQ